MKTLRASAGPCTGRWLAAVSGVPSSRVQSASRAARGPLPGWLRLVRNRGPRAGLDPRVPSFSFLILPCLTTSVLFKIPLQRVIGKDVSLV